MPLTSAERSQRYRDRLKREKAAKQQDAEPPVRKLVPPFPHGAPMRTGDISLNWLTRDEAIAKFGLEHIEAKEREAAEKRKSE